MPGMTHVFELTIARTDRAGRLRALLDMGAKTVAVLSDGREERTPGRAARGRGPT